MVLGELERHRDGFGAEIVHGDNRAAVALAGVGEHGVIAAGRRLAKGAVAEFGAFLALADHALDAVEQRLGIASRALDVYFFKSKLALAHDRLEELLARRGGEAGVRLGRPLHRRAHRIALGQREVFAHADLVAEPDPPACPAA